MTAPTLNRITMPSRPAEVAHALPGDTLQAIGAGFGAGTDNQSAVLVTTDSETTITAPVVSWSDALIRFTFPDGTGSPGARQIQVRTRQGASAPVTVTLEDTLRLSAAPVALLPLGLQTRFMADGRELWVRALPDTVHVDSHDERLTAEEADLGRRYRDATGTARDEVWLDLTTRFGAPRAEWIVRATLTGTVVVRDTPWARAARSRLLPRRLYAYAYDDLGNLIATQYGQPIPFELPIGPDLNATGSDPARTPGMAWLVDFDQALAVGMAVKLRLPSPPPDHIARLVVVGAETSLTPTQGADELGDALAAHRYTRGVGFLSEGTATNLTPDAGDAGPAGPGRPADGPSAPAVDGNADAAARALGLTERAAELFGGTPAGDDGAALRRARRAMNTALWPATWGYFLEHMFAPAVPAVGQAIPPEAIESAREHFVGWVRGAGPQPVLRLGQQPYGLLPVLPLDHWSPAAEEPAVAELAGLLRDSLRPIWTASVGAVPRISDQPQTTDPDTPHENPLLTVLSLQPTSVSFRGRSVLDMTFVDAAWRFIRDGLGDAWRTEQATLARQALDAHGLADAHPNLVRTVFASNYFPVPFPLVQGSDPQSQPLAVDWLSQLRDAGWQTLRDDVSEGPLLYLLLRHSLLASYLSAAGAMEPADPWRGGEDILYGIDEIDDNLDAPRPRIVWDRLTVAASTGQVKGDLLDTVPTGALADVRAAIDALVGAPVQVLEQAAAETLDLCSHRLDAWITSFAQRRLSAIRGGQATGGLHLGAYGIVEDIRHGDGGGSAGYVHTPSLSHATAAAILASGYRSHPDGGGVRRPFGVDLSSDRVRVALSLLDGVRAGQPLGALLGYRFERLLQERGLARFIDDFRAVAPSPATGTAPDGPAVEAVGARNVVDALELHRRWVAAGRTLAPGWPGTDAAGDLQPVFEQLDDGVDALGDILLTEGVFQLGRGNTERAAAALRAAAQPGGAPPELEAIYTPHSGTGSTHRLAVLLPGAVAGAPGWSPDTTYARRAAAEPRLDAWAGLLLGDPKRVRYRVRYLDPAGGAVLAEVERRLDQVVPALSPLDVVYAAVATERDQLSELEQRLVFDGVRNRPAGVPPDARVQVIGSREPELADKISLLELMELAQSLRETLDNARPVTPDDLSLPEAAGTATVDLAEMEGRANAAVAALRAADTALQAAIGDPAAEQVRAALLAATGLSVPGAVPLSATGDTPDARTDLATQAGVVRAEVRRRLAQVDGLAVPAQSDPAGRLTYALDELGAVFGAQFRALPRYTAPQPDRDQMDVSFAASASLLAGDAFAATRWFQQLTRVREGARRLGDLLLYADALGGADPLNLRVAQVPAVPGDRWLGLPLAAGAPPAGRVSLVALLPAGPVSAAGTVAGLVVEEYSEVLPAPAKTTGMALHYDQPNATPPQTIVLAVPPRQGEDWTLDTLRDTVRDTFDLARIRMVDLDALQEAGHFVPATYLAYNAKGVTVATDFLTGLGVPLG